MTLTTTERAIAAFAVEDEEWAALEQFMPPQIGKIKIDWRHVLDCLLIRFGFGMRGVAWHRIPNSSTIRMAFMKAVELGVFARIEDALPRLNVRRGMWMKVIEGAKIAATRRRNRANG